MIKIGLTGGICSGKTYVLSILQELGCYTVKADEIAKKIVFSNREDIIDQIVKTFGEEIYDKKNGINKEQFARMLFDSPEKRLFVDQLVHPLVAAQRRNIISDLEESGVYDFFIYESALLVESGIYKEFDKVVVVYTSEEEQMRRLMERENLNADDALKRIRAQFPLSEKLKVAHYAIDTTGSFENVRTLTLETFHLLRRDCNLI